MGAHISPDMLPLGLALAGDVSRWPDNRPFEIEEGVGVSSQRFGCLVTVLIAVTVAACSSIDPTSSEEYEALEQELERANAQLSVAMAEVGSLQTEVDAQLEATSACSSDPTLSDEYLALEQDLERTEGLAWKAMTEVSRQEAEKAAQQERSTKSKANADRIAQIIDDPDAIGTQQEVLDDLMSMVAPGAVMNDTAFGAVPMRQAWANTLWGSDATIKTWVTWMCDDGSQSGSLWTWTGEATNGNSFDLVGVNLDDYDADGNVTYSLVDWPYDRAYVTQSITSGNTASD